MNLFAEALAYLLDAASWTGTGGLGARVLEHLAFSGAVLLVAAAIGVPAGIAIGHSGRGRGLVVALTSGGRAIPTLGLLTIFGLLLGIGLEAPFLALVVLALPPVLAGAYAGVESVDRQVIGGARAIGMTERQIVMGVELPLASPVLVGGLRSAALQVISTATLAAYVSDTGLGRLIFAGLKTRDYGLMLAGSILVALLALVVELLFQVAQSAAARRAEPLGPDSAARSAGGTGTTTTTRARATERNPA